MAPDLRELLEAGAGRPPDLPDVQAIWRRSRLLTWRRRLTTSGVVLALVLGGWIVVRSVELGVPATRPADVPARPGATPLEPGPLSPGTYRTTDFRPAFSLAVPDSRWESVVLSPSWVALRLDYRHYLNFQVWDGVHDPADEEPGPVEALPADLATWLQSHPRLEVIDAAPVNVGGLTGIRLDLRVSKALEVRPPECQPQQCVLLGRVPGEDPEPVDLAVGDLGRYFVLDLPEGGQIVVQFRAPEGLFQDVARACETLLRTVRFDAPA